MKINKSNITPVNRIELYKIEGLSDAANKFLQEEADFLSSCSFITVFARADGMSMDGAFFCTGDLSDFLDQVNKGEIELPNGIFDELESLLNLLREQKIDEIQF